MNRTTIKAEGFSIAVEARAVVIAMQNDEFRRGVLFKQSSVGRAVFTSGVSTMEGMARERLLQSIATFTAFSEGDDPNGEHDFLSVEQDGHRYFAKIDYFDDPWMEFGSDDPSDPTKCYRVLTIMRADEY